MGFSEQIELKPRGAHVGKLRRLMEFAGLLPAAVSEEDEFAKKNDKDLDQDMWELVGTRIRVRTRCGKNWLVRHACTC